MKVTHVLKVKTNFFWDSLNVIRASILGANDGIISVSGIVLGAAGANLDSKTLFNQWFVWHASWSLFNGWWRMDICKYPKRYSRKDNGKTKSVGK